jgi:hypothetical protein
MQDNNKWQGLRRVGIVIILLVMVWGSSMGKFYGIKVSKSGIPVQQASDSQLIYKDDFSTKTYYDNTNSRIVEGKLPDGNYGMWVSKPGFNVTDQANSLGNLVFNSNQNVFKIIYSGTAHIADIPAAAAGAVGTSSTTIHTGIFISDTNLPLCMIFLNNGGQIIQIPYYGTTGLTAGNPFNTIFYGWVSKIISGELTIFIEGDNYTGSPTVTGGYDFKAYLLQETIK